MNALPAVLLVLLLLALGALTFEIYRDRTMRRAVRDVVNDVEAGERHGPACRHPGCLRARQQLRQLVDPRHLATTEDS